MQTDVAFPSIMGLDDLTKYEINLYSLQNRIWATFNLRLQYCAFNKFIRLRTLLTSAIYAKWSHNADTNAQCSQYFNENICMNIKYIFNSLKKNKII